MADGFFRLNACVEMRFASRMNMADTSALPDATHRLDVLGFHCPIPVAKTKEALARLPAGAVLEVLADDPETLHDLPLFLGRSQHLLKDVHQSNGEYRFLIEVVT